MHWIIMTSAFLMVAGILAAAGLIVSRKPEAAKLIDKLTPWQGWVGIVLLFWGIYDIINSIGALAWGGFILFLVYIIVAVIEILLGFLLGFGLITKFALSKNDEAKAKGQAIRGKLAPFQGILGFLAIAVAIVLPVVAFIFV